jgi:N-acetylglucosamine kinase-like BadF-type ATPase
VTRIALAVDGGNSKTDLALVREDGELLALVRGPMSSPHHLGLEGALDVVETLLARAALQAGLGSVHADVGALLIAGADFADEEEDVRRAATERGWADAIWVGNDTFAVLRAGTDRGWGVAVVCGAGINCVGVAPDGRHARFLSLGEITGDWGGGYDVGLAAVSAAARSEDGRGARTSLEALVPGHFELDTPTELAEAIHRGRIPQRRVVELAPVVLAAAADDAVAAEIVARLEDEIATMALTAIRRLDLDGPIEVLLGGGLVRAAGTTLVDAVAGALAADGTLVEVRACALPPIAGAALLGLDRLEATEDAKARLRDEIAAAMEEVAVG